MQDENLLKELEEFAKNKNIELFKISAVTGDGIDDLMNRVTEVLKELPKEELVEVEEKMVYTLEDKDEFTVTRDGDEYLVEGPAIERLMGRINIGDNESMHYFQKVIRNLGIEEELKKKGVRQGDTVKFLEWEFEWEE